MKATRADVCCLLASLACALACADDGSSRGPSTGATVTSSHAGRAATSGGSNASAGVAASSGAVRGGAEFGGSNAGAPAQGGGDTSDGGSTANVGGTISAGAANAGGNTAKWVGGYYVGYQRNQYPANEIDFTSITHLFVGAGLPRADGTIDMSLFITATEGPALARDLVGRAHAAGRKAILMLGGAGAVAGFRAAAADAIRPKFVQQLSRLVDDYGFDGLDLDWEPILAADRDPLLRLTRDLRGARPGLVITVPVGYLNVNYETVDPFFAELASVVDQMNLMTYAMAGSWEGWQSWHSSPLAGEGSTTPTSIGSSIQRYLDAGISAHKLGIGIGFYGICYSAPVTGPNQALAGATCTVDDNSLSYANIMTGYFSPALRKFDDRASVPYLSSATPIGAGQCTFLSYEDEESIARKGAYAKAAGLGGTIIWTVNEGHLATAPAGERDPLLVAVRKAFLE